MTIAIEALRSAALAFSADHGTEEVESAAGVAPTESPTTASSDAEVVRRLAPRVMAFVEDMFSLLEAYQARSRDSQATTQERQATSRSTSAAQAHTQRVAELERAVVDRARAAESDFIGNIFRVIGTAISLAVGTVGAIFTGGASLVAAIAVAVAVLGPLVMQGLAEAGVVDQQTAAAVSLGIAAACTLVSFGASAASLAGAASSAALVAVDAATRAVIETATQITSIIGSLANITSGGLQINTAVLNHDAAQHDANATELGHRRDVEQEAHDEAIEIVRRLFQSFARVAESMAAAREEVDRARQVALQRI